MESWRCNIVLDLSAASCPALLDIKLSVNSLRYSPQLVWSPTSTVPDHTPDLAFGSPRSSVTENLRPRNLSGSERRECPNKSGLEDSILLLLVLPGKVSGVRVASPFLRFLDPRNKNHIFLLLSSRLVPAFGLSID